MIRRRRMIDPSLWEDEHFGELSDKGKILFVSCISNADDDGRINANVLNLRALAFRFAPIKPTRIEKLLAEIVQKMPNVSLYNVNGCRYIQLKKWEEYQTQHKDRRKPSIMPPCPTNVDKCPPKLSKDKLSKDKALQDTPSITKKKHLDCVYLTIEEYDKLCVAFTKGGANDRIANLNGYIGSKGAKYKSHYLTILNWERKNKPKETKPKNRDYELRVLNP